MKENTPYLLLVRRGFVNTICDVFNTPARRMRVLVHGIGRRREVVATWRGPEFGKVASRKTVVGGVSLAVLGGNARGERPRPPPRVPPKQAVPWCNMINAPAREIRHDELLALAQRVGGGVSASWDGGLLANRCAAWVWSPEREVLLYWTWPDRRPDGYPNDGRSVFGGVSVATNKEGRAMPDGSGTRRAAGWNIPHDGRAGGRGHAPSGGRLGGPTRPLRERRVKCATAQCASEAAVEVFWPGDHPKGMCPSCAVRASGIADALGFYLPMRPAPDGTGCVNDISLDHALERAGFRVESAPGGSKTARVRMRGGPEPRDLLVCWRRGWGVEGVVDGATVLIVPFRDPHAANWAAAEANGNPTIVGTFRELSTLLACVRILLAAAGAPA